VRFQVLGGDPNGTRGRYLESLRAEVEARRHGDWIEFVGEVADVAPWLAKADVLLHTAHREPFGRAVVEAMANGVPVVAIRAPHGPAEILAESLAGRLVDREPDALAATVVELLGDRRLRQRMGEAGRQLAREKYDRALMAQRLAALYAELIAPKPGPMARPQLSPR
jgi:glycosyltransferase involved in cell wall biosynthesis